MGRTAPPRPRAWLPIAGGLAAALLMAVHLMESVGGYTPCALCLRQREALWTALAVAAVGWIAGRRSPGLARVAVVGVSVAFLVGAAVAGWHAGIEWRWWPGPPCTAPPRAAAVAVGAADVAAILSGAKPFHPVACDQAALRIAGLSLAGWNALISTALALAGLLTLLRKDRP